MSVIINPDHNYNSKTLAEKLTTLRPDYDPENHLSVVTMFRTIQGEMPFAGMPAIFLRLAGCNRGVKTDGACYFCDTFFSPDQSLVLPLETVIDELEALVEGMHFPLLVITGGEPLLQARALINLLPMLDEMDKFVAIQFETNGDLFKSQYSQLLFDTADEINEENGDYDEDAAIDFPTINFVISPKRTIAQPKGGAFMDKADEPGYYLRLVISGDPQSQYYNIPDFLLDEEGSWPLGSFYISPLTEYCQQPKHNEIADIRTDIDIDATRRNVARAIELATKHSLRVSLQAHSYIGIA